MHQLTSITRPLNYLELRWLNTLLKGQNNALKSKFKVSGFIVAAIIGTMCTWMASKMEDSFWLFLVGTIAIFSWSFIVFMPYELYKMHKNNRRNISLIEFWIKKGTVTVYPISALQIAKAIEYDDEGDLFIVEYDPDRLIYIWDHDGNLRKKFPCLNFEIYEDDFATLTGRPINPLSEKIMPVEINKMAKWAYMKHPGIPGHLDAEVGSFAEVVDKINKTPI